MARKKLISICHSGGEFGTSEDGSVSYNGGEAHAIDIDHETRFEDFKTEIAEMLDCNPGSMSIKYFLVGNRKTLITISNDKDFQRMVSFNEDSTMVDVYIIVGEMVVNDVSNMPGSRSSRTSLSEAAVPGEVGTETIVPANNAVEDARYDNVIDDPPIAITSDSTPLAIGTTTLEIDTTLGIDTTLAVDTPLAVDTTLVVDTTPLAVDSTPLAVASVPNNDKNHLVSSEWETAITGVTQRFRSVHEFREALRKYAVAHGFAYKYKKNESHRVSVKCKTEGCPWRIYAARLSTTQLFVIKKMDSTHTCEGGVMASGSAARMNWVAGLIKDILRDSPHYRPKDIVDYMKQNYGIELNYAQAWRAKDIARERLQGSFKEAYNQLPFLCERILETNPGSFATFSTKDDSSFHRLFIALHASVHGFQEGCRPLLFLDSTPLNSKYQGTLLAATAADGNDCVFPVAFAVVDAETDDNWHWFLVELKAAVSASRSITFVADMEKGLNQSIAEIFENGYHAYCLRYLTEKFKKDLQTHYSNEVKRLLVDDFYSAAYALKYDGFERCTESIKGISPEAYNWVVQSKPIHWANVFFEGARFNHMKSNFGELFYSWVSEANELPITQMVELLRCKMMEMIYTRREDSNEWSTTLTPSMEEKLLKETLKARSLEVLFSPGGGTDGIYDVGGDTIEKVDIDRWICSCKGWQITGLPCCHAIAVFMCTGRSTYDYCLRYFTTESYRITYSKSIMPVPNVGNPIHNDSPQAKVKVTPPPTRRPPGRPKLNLNGSQGLDKRKFQCSKCKGMGHNKLTCKGSV